MAERRIVRCAVYTRKSTEDGLDQQFNSLDAQYEACAAYVVSQRHEGWTLLPDRYDDGGFSGGNMDRPGFRRLLADVADGRIDTILIYKLDRLTRNLSDFAKIVDILDRAGANFVSITQSFNTTTSMGRLTLNMLLSFAQFEREVTGERIRDKIAASKRKGLWMGGPVPLGYDVRDRKLTVNENEADLVRHIMERYCSLKSVVELEAELGAAGNRTKRQVRTSGPHRGGVPFRRGTLFHLLKNRIYLGEIVHKGDSYPGKHAAIVPIKLWERVQRTLAERASGEAKRGRVAHPSMLVGKLVDGGQRPMTPTHARKSTRRYRYYVTRPDQLGSSGQPAWRVSAADLESIVVTELAALLLDGGRLHDVIVAATSDPRAIELGIRLASLVAAKLQSGSANEKARIAATLVERVRMGEGRIAVAVSACALLAIIEIEADQDGWDPEPIMLHASTAKARRGQELRLVIPSAAPPKTVARERDPRSVALLVEAFQTRELILANPERSLNSLAAEHGRCRTRMATLFQLSFLAPDLVAAVMEGRGVPLISAAQLSRTDLAPGWAVQRQSL